MADRRTSRDDVLRLTRELVLQGTRVRAAFVARHGLHATDVEALTAALLADERQEPLTAGALAAELGLTSGAVTAVVDRLERAGHLRRVRDEQDRRRVLLRPSDDGRALAQHYLEPIRARSDTVLDAFTAAELDAVRRFLEATGAAMAAHGRTLREEAPAPPAAREVRRRPRAERAED